MNRNKIFEVHSLNEAGIEKAKLIRDEFDTFCNKLLELIPNPSRETSIVMTKLEEACFFAKKSMANAPENQTKDC